MEGKKKNVFIAILGVTTVAAAGAALYFGLKYNSLKIEASKKDEVISESNENDTTPKEIEKIVTEYGIPEVTTENCLNKANENAEYEDLIRGSYPIYGMYYSVEPDGKTIALNVIPNELKKYFPDLSIDPVHGKTITFDSKVKRVYIGSVGNGSETTGEVMFCILEDGSVQCMNLYNAISSSTYNFTKLDDVSDIVEVKNVSFSYKNGIGYSTIVAFNKDGKFYDLQNTLRNKGIIK